MQQLRISASILAVVVLGVALVFGDSLWVSSQQQRATPNQVLDSQAQIELGRAAPALKRPAVSGGVMTTFMEATGAVSFPSGRAAVSPPVGKFTEGCSSFFPGLFGGNVRVNQDCSLRRQAEEVIAINPRNPDNLIAGANDSRIGFNHCSYAWSFDGGKTWGDQTPPFWQFLLLDGRTTDACSDPTATFDSEGNAYVGGIIFNVAADANAIVVTKSNAPIGGAFYHTPNSTLSFQTYRTVPLGVVSNDNSPIIFNDKEFIVADANPGSPKADNVYATWTLFKFSGPVGQESPIFFSQSTDGGATWSTRIEISGSGAFCTAFSNDPANPTRCDQDQGSHPIVGPDGTVYVIFGNGNTPLPGINQVLMVKCPGTADCSNASNWMAPVKINDLIGTHPVGNAGNLAGCPVGRQCLPPNGYRVPEFTSMSLSIDQLGRLYAVWSDFRNGDDAGSTCGPFGAWTTRTPPCNNDVFYSFSTNGGVTWSPAVNVAPAVAFGPTAQWQPWSAVTADGSRLYVAYYDRSYGNCEFTGCNDITLATVFGAATATPAINYLRITTGSMPNLILANNPVQAGFLGDYMWVAVDSSGRPHIVWADTRGLNGTVEEDVYYFRGR